MLARPSEVTISTTGERVDGFHALPSQAQAVRQWLTITMCGGDVAAAPSRHLLDDVDIISFGRGEREATRDFVDGMRRLVLRIPDRMMSADHARMLRAQGRWMLADPASKNGTLIAGRPTRCGVVESGDIIELGRTVILFDESPVQINAPADQILFATRQRELASFHPDLVIAAESIAMIAPSNVPVLFHGESGTGKEVYARVLHELSGRAGPLVAVNCGALAPSLLEAELFGHRRGAFSGALADRTGFVRSAAGGTLFLDEICELSPAGQVALLRVLQEREVVPVGDSQPVRVDVRVCAASQSPLLRHVEAGTFRNDLYARLLGYELRLPQLRERSADSGYLVDLLLARMAPQAQLTPAAMRGLIAYNWPRNIRELERCLATALVLARNQRIGLEHLPGAVQAAAERGRIDPTAANAGTPPDGGDDPLRRELVAKLREHRGNVSAVARDLGKHREQIQRWIRRYQLDPNPFRRSDD